MPFSDERPQRNLETIVLRRVDIHLSAMRLAAR
jgi:hypothetical protein